MDEAVKKKLLRRIPYGLYVIGVRAAAGPHAFTATFLTQCSFSPPRILVGVRGRSRSLEHISESRVFSVNFLAAGDAAVAERFFKAPASEGGRFGDLGFTLRRTGAPILDRAVAFLECDVVSITETGDHSAVVGQIVEAEIRKDERPLILSDTPWHYGG